MREDLRSAHGFRRPNRQAYRSGLYGLYGLDGGVFGGDEDRAGDFYVEFLGVVALVDGYAYAASGVDVEKGVAYRDVHEGLAVREGYGLFVDLDRDFVACYVA